MVIKRLICLLFVLYATIGVYSQDTGLFNREEWEKANTAADAKYLSTEEKEVFRYLNLVRLNGKKFFDSFLDVYMKHNNDLYSEKIKSNNSYLISLKKDLSNINGLQPIYPDERLFKAAEYHASDMGKKGTTGHNSSDGTGFFDRMKHFMGTEYYLSENCSYGYGDALDIVCNLLLDNGIPSLGHRKNILNPEQNMAGVSIRPHTVFETNCVIDFYSGPEGFLKK
ncbi:MAG TPA: CAP domain-containing protein [Bacteroidales bacterium]|nr:CAP domain-containing protein [Bacteroidales bacterium]HPT11058.1 CAP domain-containing protein [Bacteroidales bacterium]